MNQGDEGLPFEAADSRGAHRPAPSGLSTFAGAVDVAFQGRALHALILDALSYAPELPYVQARDLPPHAG